MSSSKKFTAALMNANTFFEQHGIDQLTESQLCDALVGVPEEQKTQVLYQMEQRLARIPTTPFLGVKPTPEAPQSETFFTPLEDRLWIRFFAGGALPNKHFFFFDLYDPELRIPKNAPDGYEFKVISPAGLAGPFDSVERLAGEVPKEGLEKFCVPMGATCELKRPGHAPFQFQVPLRAPAPGVAGSIPSACMQ
ncbi:hypothetical protein FB45DRAFT_913250 [Roridomyces roridus]|uniref:Uncharacterized protein n=1 Tax=Roridomyces roridus TaxID=1738132 RepID=A0AAD7BY32_9AGAR|nr:hypothetical protein FB45DRAFT_913250 [Roridomyces roridus]